jgi:hypothetical protein
MLGINPGASTKGAYKSVRKHALEAFTYGNDLALQALWLAMSDDADNHWNARYLARLRALDLDPGALLVGNIALCATAKDRYPKRMLNACWSDHTAEMLKQHEPSAVIFMGAARLTSPFMQQAATVMPHGLVLHIAHYAHRKGSDFEAKECLRIRDALASRLQT